ncbi:hypothetical protein F5884DRAFT_687623 [Xylogone sp. PMI_703]|nr:hypothetical protein F5884DRAFT_687623 [Xylogone sp. PMI_703]
MLLSLAAPGLVTSAPHCAKVAFEVTASAENIVFTDLPDLTNSQAIIDYLNAALSSAAGAPTNGVTTVGGSFTILGKYCAPDSAVADTGVLEYFIHGATYNQTVWYGLDINDIYNWPLAANANGYHTLTVESLGHGQNPDRPDPFATVQAPLQIEINHQILMTIRNDGANPLGKTFDKIALVGHSYGSSVGTGLVRLHPSDVEAFVVTGWSNSLSAQATLDLKMTPAVDVFPQRFSGLAKGYVTPLSEQTREGGFYAGAYDPTVPQKDYPIADTATMGELLTLEAGALMPAPEFSGSIFVVTGDSDVLLCNTDFGICNNILNATNSLFPRSNYEFYVPMQTGHDLSLHLSAPTTLNIVHEWLDKVFQ